MRWRRSLEFASMRPTLANIRRGNRMKTSIRCLMTLALCSTSFAWASGVVHVADGDCDSLSSAAGSASGSEPTLIVLARNGHYACQFTVKGQITIDGAGANFAVGNERADLNAAAQ